MLGQAPWAGAPHACVTCSLLFPGRARPVCCRQVPGPALAPQLRTKALQGRPSPGPILSPRDWLGSAPGWGPPSGSDPEPPVTDGAGSFPARCCQQCPRARRDGKEERCLKTSQVSQTMTGLFLELNSKS